MSEALKDRLRQVRIHLGMTVIAITDLVGLKSRKTWERYEAGANVPDSDTLRVLHEHGIDINWLLTGQGQMVWAERQRQSGTVPVLGLADCGLQGWYQESPTGLFAAAPPAVVDDPDGVAVIAMGESMRPAGIAPGDLVFCQSVATHQDGDPVLVELADGKMALKRWGGSNGGWVTLSGWLAPEGGTQMPYTDQRRADQVVSVRRVVLVQPGPIQGAGVAPGQELTADDRLYEVVIRAALRWREASGVMTAADVTAATISRMARMLRQGAEAKTDAQLEADVAHILDVARDMGQSLKDTPRRS